MFALSFLTCFCEFSFSSPFMIDTLSFVIFIFEIEKFLNQINQIHQNQEDQNNQYCICPIYGKPTIFCSFTNIQKFKWNPV